MLLGNIVTLLTTETALNERTARVLLFQQLSSRGWSGGAMVLGKLPVPGRPTIWLIVGQGPMALAIGVWGVVWTVLLSSILTLIFLLLSWRRPDID